MTFFTVNFLMKRAIVHREVVGFCAPSKSFVRIRQVHSRSRTFVSSTSTTTQSFDEPSNTSPNNVHAFRMSLSIPTRDVMEEVGELLSVVSEPPDVITLDGDLGAGKTCFARGFILCKLGVKDYDDENDNENETSDPDVLPGTNSITGRIQQQQLQVTSPTYLLSNMYPYRDEKDGTLHEIHHMDLYRLPGTSPKDFEPLALPHVFSRCISLIEWPSRLASFDDSIGPPKSNLLEIYIRILPSSDERVMTLTANEASSWKDRLQHLMDEGMVDDLRVIVDELDPDNE
ncbi:phospholipid-translocating P-type ATPase, flippase [Nitzschia inconspicua]|uniref:Phospholipid-translocating P-type ATPase, flippase n=1 Tax=Nitzschia inconspicua TaxID=303405 RepID=A0A9K3KCM7_9STRA|nr:phospholipid-translocating P-type ATPase, flippase [Nitzschia inconspicua]